MVRNFQILNLRPFRPTRSCRKKIGPGSAIIIGMNNRIATTIVTTEPNNPQHISINRFIITCLVVTMFDTDVTTGIPFTLPITAFGSRTRFRILTCARIPISEYRTAISSANSPSMQISTSSTT